MPWLGEAAAAWSLAAVVAAFVLLGILEAHGPARAGRGAGARWLTNLMLYAATIGTAAVLVPERPAELLLAGWSAGPLAWAGQHGGPWVVLGAGLLLLDALAYALHRMQHLHPFWRLHAVHHADTQVDVTTGFRHHPGEALVNVLIGAFILVLAGLPPWVAPVYGLLIAVWDVWSHADIVLPPRLERALSALVVTPGLHRVHHSDDPAHYGTNFGGVLTVWDRLFGTWRPAGTEKLRFGVPGTGEQGLAQALAAPFHRRSAVPGDGVERRPLVKS